MMHTTSHTRNDIIVREPKTKTYYEFDQVEFTVDHLNDFDGTYFENLTVVNSEPPIPHGFERHVRDTMWDYTTQDQFHEEVHEQLYHPW